MILQGKRILLGVTGGIAAYKAADLASKLVQAGAQVDVILTAAATAFVTPLTFESLTHRAVHTDVLAMATVGEKREIAHIMLAKAADLFVVAPVTAQTLAKLALGLADDLLGATALSCPAPLLLAPAMESHMWEHPATQEHVRILRDRGATFVGPAMGRLASGALGVGRMAEPLDILEMARAVLGRSGPLARRRVVITAGGTLEPLDPVRVLTNRSSGKMGVALAQAARDAGAAVILVHAPLAVPVPQGIEVIAVRSAVEMHDAVFSVLGNTDVLIGAAAVADFRPADAAVQKIKKGETQELLVRLVRNPDILAEVSAYRQERDRPRVVVGFAAETEDLLKNAQAKMATKHLDMIVANDVTQVGSGFGADDNRVILLHKDGKQEMLPLLPKMEVAERVVAQVGEMLGKI
ncbi:MAG: bifunctional phosphopantothenoylcysteine decarboxylase/phosphopantothenate--cysteine ligase CoaBC [Anaerolineae bacterium]|nr:bifunctional phosphopantothenoylcysteine decarboxylase/phosphopantothenate--cysteine ligase CoaBC [Anaerolineae bacterium]